MWLVLVSVKMGLLMVCWCGGGWWREGGRGELLSDVFGSVCLVETANAPLAFAVRWRGVGRFACGKDGACGVRVDLFW